MKKILTLLLTLLLVSYAHVINAEDNLIASNIKVPILSEKTNLADLALLFSDDEKIELEALLDEISSTHNMDIVIVTTTDANGLTSEEYADDFYDYNGYKDDGVLILYDFDNRYIYISTKGKAINYISNYSVNSLLELYDDFSEGTYLKVSKKCINQLDKILSSGESGNIIDGNNSLPSEFTSTNIIIGLAIGAIAALIYTLILKGQLKSVSNQYFASNYIDNGSFALNGHADFFVGSHVSKTPIPKNNNSSRGFGGGSSSHSSSSGSHHGGGGRRF